MSHPQTPVASGRGRGLLLVESTDYFVLSASFSIKAVAAGSDDAGF